MSAAKEDRTDTVEALLEWGAKVNTQTKVRAFDSYNSNNTDSTNSLTDALFQRADNDAVGRNDSPDVCGEQSRLRRCLR